MISFLPRCNLGWTNFTSGLARSHSINFTTANKVNKVNRHKMDGENGNNGLNQSQQHVWGDCEPQDNDMDYDTDNDSLSEGNDDANGPEMYFWQYGLDDGIDGHDNDGNDDDIERLDQWSDDGNDIFADVIQADDGQHVLQEFDGDDDDGNDNNDGENDDANGPEMYFWQYGLDDGIDGQINDDNDDEFEELDQWQNDHDDIFANVIQADDGQHVWGEVDGDDDDGDENDDANRPEMSFWQYGIEDGINGHDNDGNDDDFEGLDQWSDDGNDIFADVIQAYDGQHRLGEVDGDDDDENDDANRPEMYVWQYAMDDSISDSPNDDDILGDVIWGDDRQHDLEDIAGDIDVVQFPTVEVSQQQADAGSQCVFCLDDYDVGEKVRQLPCEHYFHTDCLAPWLIEHNTCPTCRTRCDK